MNERELFLSAVEIEDPQARREYLLSQCGSGSPLMERVESLLASHEGDSDFLNLPAMEQVADESGHGVSASTPGAIGSGEPGDAETAVFDPDEETLTLLGHFLEPSDRPDAVGRLGHYDVCELIGRGAYGIVLKAFDDKLQRVVAIKVLSPEMALTSPARKRFLREARASAQVHHENVVSIYAVEDSPIPHLVMEYVPGETLQQRLEAKGPLDVADVLRLGQQIADGLDAAHAQGLIHRDVKPSNILLDRSVQEQAKITDFGLARTADDASMTQSGMIAGTPLYMAPEQALGNPLDQRADLFSLGSVLYQMLSGRPPFRAPTTVAVLRRVTEDEPRPIPEIIAEVPDWVCEIVHHLHAKDPDQRYSTAKQVSAVLADCLSEFDAGRVPSVPRPEGSVVPGPVVATAGNGIGTWVALPAFKIAAAFLIVIGLFAIAEAADVTNVSSTIIRIITPGKGTLVVEVEDPTTTVAIDGEELIFTAAGLKELKLKPGEHGIVVKGPGGQVRRELVHVERGGKTAFTVSRVQGPVKAVTEDYPVLSPFQAVRWQEDQPEVKVDADWVRLMAINDTPVSDIVSYCVAQFDRNWQKRFEEDLVRVLSEMGKRPGTLVDLTVADLNGENEQTLRDVTMTRAKRQALWRSLDDRRTDAEKAGSGLQPVRSF